VRERPNAAKGAATILAVLLICAAAGLAEGQVLGSGAIEGRVTDETAQALPGVTVTASSPALLVQRIVQVTNGQGDFRFPDLPAGLYKLSFELSGFSTLVRDEIRLNAGFVGRIDAQLKIGSLEETVTVSGQSPVVDVVSTGRSTNLTLETLDKIPTTRSVWQALGMAPGVRSTGIDVGGNQLAIQQGFRNYGTSGQNTPMIEGVNTRQADGSVGIFYDYSSFDEVQVKAVGMDAETALPGTSYLGIVKSGGNNFHGSYFFGGSSDKMQSENIDDALRSQGVTRGNALQYFWDVSGDLGGRILRDKIWFYGGLRRQHAVSDRLGYSKAPGPDGIYGTADDVPGRGELTQPNGTLKLSFQLAKNYKAIAFYQRSGKIENERLGSRFVPFEATQRGYTPMHATKGEIQGTPSDRVLFNAQYGLSYYISRYPAQDGVDRPGNPSHFNRETGLTTGPPAMQDVRPRGRWQSTGSARFFPARTLMGQHELKAGYQTYWEWVGTGFADKPSGNYRLIFDRVNGIADQPTQIETYNYPILEPSNREAQYSIFLADNWRMGGRLTLNVGARYDFYDVFVDEQTKVQGQFGTAGHYPKIGVITSHAVAPRFGLAYDLFGNAKSVIKATYGTYAHAWTEDFAQNYNPNALVITTYRWRDLDGNRDYTPGEVNLDVNGPDFVSVSGASNNILDPHLAQPFTREASLGIERELAPNISVSGIYVYKRQVDLNQSVNVLRPYSAWSIPISRRDPGPDGVLGTPDDGGRVNFFDYTAAYRGSAFVGNKFQTYADGRTDNYQTLEATLNKRSSNRWDGMASFGVTKNHRWLVGVPSSPNDEFFPLDETWDWQFKVLGSYRFPHNILASGFLQSLAGAPGQRTYIFRSADPDGGTPLAQANTVTLRMEPFGTRRNPAQHVLSLRASKRFMVRSGQHLDLSVDVFNALNVNAATSVTYDAGPSFGAITQILPPRVARLVVSYAF
jgi:outer membrane receptor protein involved in Fe transport